MRSLIRQWGPLLVCKLNLFYDLTAVMLAAVASACLGQRAIVVGDLAKALARASADARAGDVVLLSPACASFDQFENFERRGEEFRRLVQNLEG